MWGEPPLNPPPVAAEELVLSLWGRCLRPPVQTPVHPPTPTPQPAPRLTYPVHSLCSCPWRRWRCTPPPPSHPTDKAPRRAAGTPGVARSITLDRGAHGPPPSLGVLPPSHPPPQTPWGPPPYCKMCPCTFVTIKV